METLGGRFVGNLRNVSACMYFPATKRLSHTYFVFYLVVEVIVRVVVRIDVV